MLLSHNKRVSNSLLNISEAKKLYFSNYANYWNMKRNGEYKEYIKYHVSETLEQEWSRIIRDTMLDKLQSGTDYWLVGNLANINMPESEILCSFQQLARSSNSQEILSAIEKAKPLISPGLFAKIIKIFLSSSKSEI